MDEELRRKQAGKRTAGTASRLESLQRSSSKVRVRSWSAGTLRPLTLASARTALREAEQVH